MTLTVLLLVRSEERLRVWIREVRKDPRVTLVAVPLGPEADALAALARKNTGVLDVTGTRREVRRFLGHPGDDAVALVGENAQPDLAAICLAATALTDVGVAAVQPVVLGPAGLVAALGAVFPSDGQGPAGFLAGHHPRDLPASPVAVPALYGPVVIARRTDLRGALAGWRGAWEPGTSMSQARLSRRLSARGRLVADPRSRVALTAPLPLRAAEPRHAGAALAQRRRTPSGSDAAWASAGWEPDGRRAIAVVREGVPQLRWTIDTASPVGKRAELWGDTHFARSLAAALEARGQHVAVDNRRMRGRATRALDDVVLVLRGLHAVEPTPGPLNLQWVISHPDLVSPSEARAFDGVFAASSSWSEWATRTWGIRVEPLLQCTDPALFSPGRADPARHHEVLFVGNSRGVLRPAVRDSLAANADLTLIGSDWDDVLSTHRPFAPSVPNRDLGALYASAGYVLNDHHEDMRRDGFIANRLFDAAACGARVISDDVPGIAAIFGPQVQVFRTPADMARLLTDPDAFPDAATRLALAEQVRSTHSFGARAQTLIEHALAMRAR